MTKIYKKKITPEEANKVLMENNPYNYRTMNYATVNIYAKDMADGNWKENGETIKFDKNGNLIDGQHRLQAVVKSNTTIEFVIIDGLDPSVADTIDIGRKRSIEQYLKWADKAYTAGATAIVQQVMLFDKENKQIGHSASYAGISQMEITDEYVRNKDAYNHVASYAKKINKESGKVLKPKEVGAIYFYLTNRMHVDEAIVKMFFYRLVNTKRNDNSIYNTTMKNLSDKDYCRRSGVRRIDEYILCWNAMQHNCRVQRNKYNEWFEKPKTREEIIEEFALSPIN